MVKKVPIRTCIVCKTAMPKKQLLRIVKNSDGEIFLDKTGKANGRGAYICNDIQCFEKLKKGKLLNKVFSCQVDDRVYQNIAEEFLGTKE